MVRRITEDQVRLKKFLDLLNDMGHNILYIDETYYIVDRLELPDYDTYHHIEVVGANISSVVFNQPITVGADLNKQTALTQQFNDMKRRLRQFHRDTKFNYYAAYTG